MIRLLNIANDILGRKYIVCEMFIFAIQLDTFRISSCTVCFVTVKSSIWFFVPPNKSLNVSKADVNIFL